MKVPRRSWWVDGALSVLRKFVGTTCATMVISRGPRNAHTTQVSSTIQKPMSYEPYSHDHR